jgi:CheY-like chemotaxis protein
MTVRCLGTKSEPPLQCRGDFLDCGETADGLEAVEKAQPFNPDVIVMDLSMPGTNALDAIRVPRRWMPAVPIIM